MKTFRKIFAFFARFFSKIQRPHTGTTEDQFLKLKSVLKDFTILLSEYDGSPITNKAIEGKFKHVAWYVGGVVYEAVTEGVRTTGLEEWFFKKDHVGAVEILFELRPEIGKKFLDDQIGKPYDFEMSLATMSAWYCSKYIWRGLMTMNPVAMNDFVFSHEEIIYPADFWENEKLFKKVFEI